VLLQNGLVKITDFGLSKQVLESDADGNVDLTSQVLPRHPPLGRAGIRF
jgi:hypothetical protein